MIAEVQCIPDPLGPVEDPYRHVEAAIAAIQASGLLYEVGALGTTVSGDTDSVWAVARAAHEAVLASGAESVVTVLKIASTADPDREPTTSDLVDKFR